LTKPRFLAAMICAIIADALQIVFLPLFLDGAKSPVEILFVCGVGVVLVYLLDWQWEFLPSFLGKLLPGIDLVPFWTMAVGGVYWRWKRIPVAANEGSEAPLSARAGEMTAPPGDPAWGASATMSRAYARLTNAHQIPRELEQPLSRHERKEGLEC
jgi:hypothetical protein